MKSLTTHKLLTLTLLLTLLFSCQKDGFLDTYESKQEIAKQEEQIIHPDNIFKLGKQLENPYSVANMKKALANLNNNLKTNSSNTRSMSKSTFSSFDIEPTHLYVKFIPKNEEELSILQADSTLILYSYPLDYEIIEGSGYYRDPEVPDGQPTYQYCAVKVDKELPKGVESEILEELFIPDEDYDEETTNSGTGKISSLGLGGDANIEALVDEALRITNNLDKTEEGIEDTASEQSDIQTRFFKRRSKWRPAGTIKVWDDNIGTTTTTKRIFSHWEYYDCGIGIDIPLYKLRPSPEERCRRAVYKYETVKTNGSYVGVEGIKVRARRWFTTHRGIADANGRYSCNGRFRRPANYSIDWERYHFALQDGWLNGATYNGPKKTGDWNLNLRNDKQAYYATIFRAAHHYYYKNIKGLRRPPLNSFWRTQMKIRAYLKLNGKCGSSEDAAGCHKEGRRFLGAQIKINQYSASSRGTYATVIHELAHAAHWNMNRSKFDDTQSKVKESWARGVEWELTRLIYPNYTTYYSRLRYTGVVEDMINGRKTRTSRYYWTEADPWVESRKNYFDKVSGYTIRQIEDALNGQKSWNGWRDNIINTINNETSENVQDAFNFWNTQ